MSKLNLGKWEVEDDQTNDQLIFRSVDTAEEFIFNEDGTSRVTDQDADRYTFGPFAGDSNGKVWKICEFGDEGYGNGITARAVRHTDRNGDEPMGSLYLESDARGTNRNFQHWVTGKQDTGGGLSTTANTVQFLVSYDSTSGRHILYAYTPGYSEFKVVLEASVTPSVIDVKQVAEDSATFSPTGTTQYDTANNGADANMGFGDTHAKVMNGVVFAGHGDFSTVQAAIDFAYANGYTVVTVPPGTYGSVDLDKANLKLVGLSAGRNSDCLFDGGTTDHAIHMTGGQTSIHNVKAGTTAAGGTNYDAILAESNHHRIINCGINESDFQGIEMNGCNDSIISQCYSEQNEDGYTVHLGSGTSRVVIDGNARFGGISNNGTGNVIGDNS